jgi:hypothetical protein
MNDGAFFASVGLLCRAYISGLIFFADPQFSALPRLDKQADSAQK